MSDITTRLAAIVGGANVLTAPADTAPFVTDWRGRYHGQPRAVVLPGSTAEVAAVMQLCRDHNIAVVPQGGNTGLVGGATPDASGREVVLALKRMNRIVEVDTDNDTLTCEAGAVLADVQAAAVAAGRLFPLSLASEGSCQIGGNLSSNAGGLAVLRYGNMRELTLGLEVVLPDGSVVHQLKGLRKNNSGYDVKQLFIGAEGTLGVITAATLKLYPLPTARSTAMVAVTDPQAAVRLLRALQAVFDDRLVAFELISGLCMELVERHMENVRLPFCAPWTVLFELADGGDNAELDARLTAWFAGRDDLADAVLAQSDSQREELWGLREDISEAQRRDGVSLKHDIALPVSRIPRFLDLAAERLTAAFPGCRIVTFGHLGDGNLHYNVSYTRPGNAELLADEHAVNAIVYDTAYQLDGTLSAEHGVGQLRRHWLARYQDPTTHMLMRTLKAALDPDNLMNPGKLL